MPRHGEFANLQGARYGRLVAVRRVVEEFPIRSMTKWVFRCDCGNRIVRLAKNVKQGLTKSCGCIRRG